MGRNAYIWSRIEVGSRETKRVTHPYLLGDYANRTILYRHTVFAYDPMNATEIRSLIPSDEPELLQQLGQLACGFPSPGLDYEEPSLSLDELVGMRAPSMFVGRATGRSMTGKGIFDRDFLIINRALTPAQDDVIVARIGNEFTVKTYSISNGVPML